MPDASAFFRLSLSGRHQIALRASHGSKMEEEQFPWLGHPDAYDMGVSWQSPHAGEGSSFYQGDFKSIASPDDDHFHVLCVPSERQSTASRVGQRVRRIGRWGSLYVGSAERRFATAKLSRWPLRVRPTDSPCQRKRSNAKLYLECVLLVDSRVQSVLGRANWVASDRVAGPSNRRTLEHADARKRSPFQPPTKQASPDPLFSDPFSS